MFGLSQVWLSQLGHYGTPFLRLGSIVLSEICRQRRMGCTIVRVLQKTRKATRCYLPWAASFGASMLRYSTLEFIRSIRDAVRQATSGSEQLVSGDKLIGPVAAVPNLRNCIKQPHTYSSSLDKNVLSEIAARKPKPAQLTRGRA